MATVLNSNHENLTATSFTINDSEQVDHKNANGTSSSSSTSEGGEGVVSEHKENGISSSSSKIEKPKSLSSTTASKPTKKRDNFKIEVPRISSRDLRPQRAHTDVNELEQYSLLFNGPGARRDSNKLTIKIKSIELEECLKKAKKFAMEQSVRFALAKQQQQQQKQQLELIKKQQAILLMCRIYVGSIFYEVKEEAVRTAFGSFGPIRSISMSWDAATNKHKGFAFIEFETPEAAQLALEQMNGSLLGGRNIKVGRPSNMPQAQPIIDQLTEDAKHHNRIYIASIHHELSEQDVQSVFEAFGTIKSCSLTRDPATGKHKGYGFIEYDSLQGAHDAITSMNMFDLGGQLLRVGKAVTPPENPATTKETDSILTSVSGSGFNLKDLDKVNLSSLTNVNQLSQATLTTSAFPSTTAFTTTSSSSSNLVSLTSSGSSASLSSLTTSQSSTQLSAQAQQQPITPPKQEPKIKPTLVSDTLMNTQKSTSTLQTVNSSSSSNLVELTENQKKLLGMTSNDDPSASLEQQTEMTLKGKEQRLILMQKLMQRKPESRVLILRNMVGSEDVDSELENEITDECGKYGDVIRVVIYQEKQGEEENAEVIVKIFVEFSIPKSIEKAVEALNGRFFAGRVVKAEVYDQSAYDSKDYSG